MAETKIEWADFTWNPWIGCTKVSPACDFCYAEALMDHRRHRVQWGGDRARTSAANWKEPFKWDRAAAAAGKPAAVFCLSLGDIWDNEVDPVWRREAFAVMEKTPNLIYLLLSKRIGNAERMCSPEYGNPRLPANAALGATMVNQEEWDRDIGKLRRAGEMLGARFTFASVEPMLGPIDTRGELPDQVICGGESGPNARSMLRSWSRSLRDQCAAGGAAYFHKQNGEWIDADEWFGMHPAMAKYGWHPAQPLTYEDAKQMADGRAVEHQSDGSTMIRVGKRRAGRLLDGRTWDEVPA